MRQTLLSVLLFAAIPNLFGQIKPDSLATPKPSTKKWYESVRIGGYLQVRYNRLLETNPDLGCEQCDKSWGDHNGFSLRRARVRLAGDLNPRLYFYFQMDLAASASSSAQHFVQIRDAYLDLGLDKKNEFRLRIGQSKVPYGFENMQSSQNRLPLDRSDGINSAVANERDLGVFFYYAPAGIRARFEELVKSGLRGSGDYGVFALGAYNGQTANRLETNNSLHTVARLSYPFKLRNGQFVEPGIQAYTGKFNLLSMSAKAKGTPGFEYNDRRIAGTIVVYPQPIGFQAEYNVGKGPRYNPRLDSIETANLKGGYVMVHYMAKINHHVLSPFVRYHFYDGGKKHELDARSYEVRDWEFGIEWQPSKNFELNLTYTVSDRRYEDFAKPDNRQKGNLLRIQAQMNY